MIFSCALNTIHHVLLKREKLQRMQVDIFFQSVVAGGVFFAAVCWDGSIRASNSNKLNALIRLSAGESSGDTGAATVRVDAAQTFIYCEEHLASPSQAAGQTAERFKQETSSALL